MMKRNAEMRTASYVANAFEKDESGILSGSERVGMFMYLGKVIWEISESVTDPSYLFSSHVECKK